MRAYFTPRPQLGHELCPAPDFAAAIADAGAPEPTHATGGTDLEQVRATERAMQDAEAVCPVVVLDGSGGVSDVLAYTWRLLHDPSPAASNAPSRNIWELSSTTTGMHPWTTASSTRDG